MNYSIILQLKRKSPAATTGNIIIRAFYNRRPVAAKSTGHRVEVQFWDKEKRQVRIYAPNAQLLNAAINNQLQKIQASLLQKELLGADISKQHIIDAIKGETNRDFIQYYRDQIKNYSNPDTQRLLESQCTKLEQFRPGGISFLDVNYKFLVSYHNYMRDELGNCENTIWSCMKLLKKMIRTAIKEGGIITVNPFDDYIPVKYVTKAQPHLDIAGCDAIEKFILDEHDHKLKAIAARFLLMCYSGMRFSDAMRFDASQHIKDGRLIMTYKKWKEDVDYKIHTRLERIVKIINDYPLNISNTDFNRQLKVIAAACRIRVKLSSKTGRHTLGYLLADNNIPQEKAQRILGHRDQRSTKVYYHIEKDQVDRELMKLNDI